MRLPRHRPAFAGHAARALAIGMALVAATGTEAPASAATSAAQLPSGVVVVRDDASGITLDYTPPSPSLETSGDSTRGLRVAVAGASSRNGIGEPDLPTAIVLFAIPAAGEPSLTIESAAYAPIGTARLAPVPALSGTDSLPIARYTPSAAIYGSDAPFPRVAAALSDPHPMGPFRVASILLAPTRWNPRSGELEALTRLRVRVDFPAAPGGNRVSAAPVLRERPASLYRRALVNFETARGFLTARPQAKAGGALASQGTEDSFASSETWIRLTVRTKGVYGVTYETLAAALASAGLPDPRTAIGSTATLRIYNGGGIDLPESLGSPPPDSTWMRQIPILVQDGGDGTFDAGDAIVFYAIGLNGFLNEFDPSLSPDVHFGSRFADDNVYWLTWGGSFAEPAARAVPALNGQVVQGSGAVPATQFLHRLHVEQDNTEDFTRYGEDGYFWYDFGGANASSFFTSATGAIVTDSSTVRIRLFGHGVETDGRDYSGSARWNSVALGDTFAWRGLDSTNVVRPFDYEFSGLLATGGNDTLKLTMAGDNEFGFDNTIYLAWFEVLYQRRYDTLGQKSLLFTSPADTGLTHYDVTGFAGSSPLLFDVTDLFGARLVTGGTLHGDTLSFERQESSLRRYALWDETALLVPTSVQVFPIDNLRDPSIQADYVIIVADGPSVGTTLVGPAGTLLAHRSRLVNGSPEFRARAVRLSQVVAQFGWGVNQPAAVRNFLLYAIENWDGGQGPGVGIVPGYAVLIGDATRDYRGLNTLRPNKNVFPTYYRISPDGEELFTFGTDDWYADITGDELPDLTLGRYPVQNATELQNMLTKVIEYETNPELGEWRSRLVFVADDEMKGCDDRSTFSPCWDTFLDAHVEDVEESAARVSDGFDKAKVYLMEYPFANHAEKPTAKQAYLTELQKGGLISHYSGHGGFDKMADENVFFASDADATKIKNGARYFIYTAYSCSIGQYDLPAGSSIAELLLRTPGGGSVASFASSAPAFQSASRALAISFTTHLMVPPAVGQAPRVGEAVLLAKREAGSDFARRLNDLKYAYLGDPGLKLAIPEKEVRIDPHPGFFSARLDSVSGAVFDGDSIATWFDGTASILVSGSADTSGYVFFRRPGDRHRAPYHLMGGTLYRGDVPVENGLWKAAFYVPSDLRQGALGRVRAFVTNGSVDGLGWADSIVTTRQSVIDSSDVTGPTIALSFGDLSYRPGMTILQSAQMGLRISDPHGINLQGDDDYFAISVTLDEGLASERTANLTSTFEYDFGRYDSGELALTLNQMFTTAVGLGPRTLTIRASDNLNNRTELLADVVLVGAQENLKVMNPLNFPNPFSDQTCIQYSLSQNADVTLKIFTVNGRLIREVRNLSGVIGDNDCRTNEALLWDGTDQEGDEVANGVYFFKVSATSADSPGVESEAVGKAVIIRR